MQSRFRKLAVESLEGRSMLSTTAFADFNDDGLLDMAAITAPMTVTVSLANPNGSYTVSAILTSSKNQPITDVSVGDYNADGKLDISGGGGFSNNKFYTNLWLGNGDGTFGNRKTANSHPNTHGGW